jgi:hypothetical protein
MYAEFENHSEREYRAPIGTTDFTYRSRVIDVQGSTIRNTRIMKNASEEQNPMWIRVREIGYGQLYIFLSRMYLL